MKRILLLEDDLSLGETIKELLLENDFLMIDRIKLYLKEYSVLKSGYTLIIKNIEMRII